MASQNNTEKSKEIDDCLTSMCAWIQDSSQIKSSENDHVLLSMLENWHPKTLFLDLPTANGSEVDAVANRAIDNALVEFSDESSKDGHVVIAQYLSTNIKRKDHNEVQRVAMHLEKGPHDGAKVLEEDVEEITHNQAKVMKKNFTYFKDGNPMHMGKIHVVNIGRERKGNAPMKFSLNYLSTNVPHREGIELKGADRERALENYNNKDAFRRTLERNKNKKVEYKNSEHFRAKSVENIADLDAHDGHHNPTQHHDAHREDVEKIEVHNDQPKQAHHESIEEFETPIIRHAKTDIKVDKRDNHDNESIDSFDTAVVNHGHSNNTGGRFHLISTENFKFPHVSTFGSPDNNINNGFARAYRYHSKRRSAHLYEWPCPNGSFRMLKTD